MGKASDWEAEGTRFNSRCAQTWMGWPDSQKSGFCHTLKWTILTVLGTENAITALGWSRYGVRLKMSILPLYAGVDYVGPAPQNSGICRDRRILRKVGWGSKNEDFQKCLGVFFPGRGSPDVHFLQLI